MKSFTEYLTEAKNDMITIKNGDKVIVRNGNDIWQKARLDVKWLGTDEITVRRYAPGEYWAVELGTKKLKKYDQIVPDEPKYRNLPLTRKSLADFI